jgi:TrmH family RNA methyltransferase
MPEFDIVLIEPLYEGNIGSTARAMKNFGFNRLVLVNPCKIGDHARLSASHAKDILRNAEYLSLDEVYDRSALTIATTGELNKSVCKSMRMPYYSPKELREMVGDIDGKVAILFGRENWGLNNDEVRRCDVICTIPTSQEYPILNLSHAVCVVCYELANLPKGTYPLASHLEMDFIYLFQPIKGISYHKYLILPVLGIKSRVNPSDPLKDQLDLSHAVVQVILRSKISTK